jgi:hypothetical protein
LVALVVVLENDATRPRASPFPVTPPPAPKVDSCCWEAPRRDERLDVVVHFHTPITSVLVTAAASLKWASTLASNKVRTSTTAWPPLPLSMTRRSLFVYLRTPWPIPPESGQRDIVRVMLARTDLCDASPSMRVRVVSIEASMMPPGFGSSSS